MIRDSPFDKLVLNCPSLEVLCWNLKVNEINFQDAKKLKRLACFSWPERVSGRLESLEYLLGNEEMGQVLYRNCKEVFIKYSVWYYTGIFKSK